MEKTRRCSPAAPLAPSLKPLRKGTLLEAYEAPHISRSARPEPQSATPEGGLASPIYSPSQSPISSVPPAASRGETQGRLTTSRGGVPLVASSIPYPNPPAAHHLQRGTAASRLNHPASKSQSGSPSSPASLAPRSRGVGCMALSMLLLVLFSLLLSGCRLRAKREALELHQQDSLQIHTERGSQQLLLSDSLQGSWGKLLITELKLRPVEAGTPAPPLLDRIESIQLIRYEKSESIQKKSALHSAEQLHQDLKQQTSEQAQITSEDKPAPDPYRWRYIFFTSLSLIALVFLLRRRLSQLKRLL